MTGQPAAARPAEISQIIAWCARLTAAGPRASTTEVAAYLAAKASLLERIAARRAAGGWAGRDIRAALQAAASARAAADAAALAAGGITTGKDQT
ncbi:MAG TPA: hypothetical protein VH637_02375 [Streptosporangiaceae bacterium]